MDVEKTMGVCRARPEKSTQSHRVATSQSHGATGGRESGEGGVWRAKRKKRGTDIRIGV